MCDQIDTSNSISKRIHFGIVFDILFWIIIIIDLYSIRVWCEERSNKSNTYSEQSKSATRINEISLEGIFMYFELGFGAIKT